jgi:quercetin dioxygenase-like cupin family protein
VTQYVFDPRTVTRYRFPTHTNDVIVPREEATAAEAFYVILEPGEAPPIHVHPDAEQVFYVLEGNGELGIGRDAAERHPLKAGDYVRTPPGTWHAVSCPGPERLVYLSIDCFTAGPPTDEPTWDSHVRQMCTDNGWDFDTVKVGRIEGETYGAGR